MEKEDLIKKLQELPDGMDVCLFDYRMCMHDDCGDGSDKGNYPEFEVTVIELDAEEAEYYKERKGRDYEPWAALIFANEDYDDCAEENVDDESSALLIHDVINCPLCGAETLHTDPERCTTIDCPNCIF